MDIYLKLFLIALVPVAMTIGVYFLQRKTAFGNMPYMRQQVIIGILFGVVAIIGTEFGVLVEDAIANVRDAGPLCAGLIFGGPAGIIAGVIGGVERWLAVYWGAGAYSQLACSISTVIAGLFAALLRKTMFEDRPPIAIIGGVIGVVMEVLHMSIFFLTKLNDVNKVLSIMQILTVPMIFANGIAVFIAVLCIAVWNGNASQQFKGRGRITDKVQFSLLVSILLAYICTTGFVYLLQTNQCLEEADSRLAYSIQDVSSEIKDISDQNLLKITKSITETLDAIPYANLTALCEAYGVTEINVVDQDGIITRSSVPEYVNFDMRSGEQSASFMVLLDRVDAFVQDYMPKSYDDSLSMKYAGIKRIRGGFVQVGLNGEAHQANVNSVVSGISQNWRVGDGGYVIVADEEGNIVSDGKGHYAKDLKGAGISIDLEKGEPGKHYSGNVYKTPAYYMYDTCEGYTIVSVINEDEVMALRSNSALINSYMQVLVYALLFGVIYTLIKKYVVDKVRGVNYSLSRIIAGDLDEKVNASGSEEFYSLSNDINATVDSLKHYIEEAASRIDQELQYAKTIQAATLPSVFPAYPNIPQFDLYATMDTAREVGGDFYDFYMIGEHKLAFIIADVSGKGIPAAMFMMTAKTLIKSLAEKGDSVNEIFTEANEELCKNNEAEMFLTAWMGILDLKSGMVSFANAGHNPPLIYRKDGTFEYLRSKSCFVLAGMEGVRYKVQSFPLNPGERIFLYTDGVTEATTLDNCLYGEDRLQQFLNEHHKESPKDILLGIKADIDAFVGDAEQFDDITMMMVDLLGFKQK